MPVCSGLTVGTRLSQTEWAVSPELAKKQKLQRQLAYAIEGDVGQPICSVYPAWGSRRLKKLGLSSFQQLRLASDEIKSEYVESRDHDILVFAAWTGTVLGVCLYARPLVHGLARLVG